MKLSTLTVCLATFATLPCSIFGALRQTDVNLRDHYERVLKSSSSSDDPNESKLENKYLELCVGFYFDPVAANDVAYWVDCDDAPRFRATTNYQLEVVPKFVVSRSKGNDKDELCLQAISENEIQARPCDEDNRNQKFFAFSIYDEKNDWFYINDGRAAFQPAGEDGLVRLEALGYYYVTDLNCARRLHEVNRNFESKYNVSVVTEEKPGSDGTVEKGRVKVHDFENNKTYHVEDWIVNPEKLDSRRLQDIDIVRRLDDGTVRPAPTVITDGDTTVVTDGDTTVVVVEPTSPPTTEEDVFAAYMAEYMLSILGGGCDWRANVGLVRIPSDTKVGEEYQFKGLECEFVF